MIKLLLITALILTATSCTESSNEPILSSNDSIVMQLTPFHGIVYNTNSIKIGGN